MSLPRRTSPRKNLSLCTKKSDDKNKIKRAKLDDMKTEEVQSKEPEIFMKLCLQVSYEAFHDLNKRFQILYLPECKDNNNMCLHGIKKISAAAERFIKIDMDNFDWFEALESCILCLTSGQCLSFSVLKDIVEIIMNAHEDVYSGYTTEYILRICQHVLLLNFSTHPPCDQKAVRDCYRQFLISPLNERKENTLTNRQQYRSEEGIVAYCFERLKYEISAESKDGALVNEKSIPKELEGEVQKLHWKKATHEVFEFLDRTVRISRLMLVLESVIELLQIDLALWHLRYYKQMSTSKNRSQKPLLTYILWPGQSICYGTVSLLCLQIMELFALFIHLKFPEEHIKTMGLWMNTIVQLFYLYGHMSPIDYPTPSVECITFCDKFVEIISHLPPASVLRILERLHPNFMRHLVGESYIQRLLHIHEKNIMIIMSSCVQETLWNNYLDGQIFASPKKVNGKMKPRKFDQNTRRNQSCQIFTVTSTDQLHNSFPRLELLLQKEDHINKMEKEIFVDILCVTFIACLESYNIKEFHRHYCSKNKKQEWDLNSFHNFNITQEFMKKYRDIVKSLQNLLIILKQKKEIGDKYVQLIYERLEKYL